MPDSHAAELPQTAESLHSPRGISGGGRSPDPRLCHSPGLICPRQRMRGIPEWGLVVDGYRVISAGQGGRKSDAPCVAESSSTRTS